MFTYYARIRDRYQRPVVSLAVLTDGCRRWHPAVYRQNLWGCKLHWCYPLVKLLDYVPPEQLEILGERLLEASRLEEIFGTDAEH